MSKNLFECIKEFHEKFGLEYDGDPQQLSCEMQKFRCKFLLEEVTEYMMATMDGDIVEQLDALVDIVYVALGTAYLQGFDFNEAFRRVHEQNMKKIRVENAEDSKRKTKFDVVKPPGWTHASLVDLCMPTDRAIVHNRYSDFMPMTGTEVSQSAVGARQLTLDDATNYEYDHQDLPPKSCDNCGRANMCGNKESLSLCVCWRSANG